MTNKRLLLLMLMLGWAMTMLAAPAQPGLWRTLTLESGEQVLVELMGDEFVSWWQAADGRTWEVATRAEERELRNAMIANRRAASTRATLGEKTVEYTGVKKGLIIMVEFSDLSFQTSNTRELYERVANEENFSEGKFVGSVRDYFSAQSYGQFTIDFDVCGPVTMPNGYAYYGANTDGYTANISALAEMIVEACTAVDSEVDFSDYDWDGDGIADMVFFLYAGQGENAGGSTDTIWAHMWTLTSASSGKTTLTLDNTQIDTYACAAELSSSRSTAGIGTFCHEFSHCLGLPDVYDTSSGGNYGMGNWDVLCYGNYNGHTYGDAYIPAGFTSYERWFAGWLEPEELSIDGDYSLAALTDEPQAYVIYNDRVKNEYFLLENRQREGWDASLAGEGLLILHIDFDASAWANNMVNYSTQRYTLFAANNKYSTSYEAGMAYPYNGNDSLTNSSTPAAKLNNTNTDGTYYMNKPITNIALEDGVVTFSFANESVAIDSGSAPESYVFYESFNLCGGKGGNDGTFDGVSVVGQATLETDNEIWVPSVGGGAWMCAFLGGVLGNYVLSGEVKSPDITTEQNAVLQFRAAPYTDDDATLTLSLLTDDNIEVETSSFTMTPGEWTTFSTELNGKGTFRLKFVGKGRFFLDEVYVTYEGANSITTHALQPATQNRIYNLAGQRVSTLGQGLYIVDGKKVMSKGF